MEERAQRRPRVRRIRRKFCAFCAEKATGIDYKDVATVSYTHLTLPTTPYV